MQSDTNNCAPTVTKENCQYIEPFIPFADKAQQTDERITAQEQKRIRMQF